MLTRKQYDLLMFVHDRLQKSGVSPSFDEMKEALDLKSKSGIHRLITSLEERGFIRRLPHRARALEVLKLPKNTTPEELPVRNRKVETLMKDDLAGMPIPLHTPGSHIQLPLYGRIAAGTPIEALRDHSNQVDVPASLLGRGDHYALEVDGDSMVEAGILDGDTIIVKKAETAHNGDIVVALVNGEEVTLKKFRRNGKSIALEPANEKYQTQVYSADQVNVQGHLVGLLRKY
ncbi:transcriptional repressor LexA [Aestuariispira insulae]|uniref:LexA repressor n=1 Tax=Aestuariispira insulae TaxID=1461337 RepID=A0A3D9HUU5_9PROT|nr:transcriptional repressor LexA [Aestuariispira insulae]RED53283.1 repressor LexA [Aestuariispira insulae]